jgi:hypothetical protein
MNQTGASSGSKRLQPATSNVRWNNALSTASFLSPRRLSDVIRSRSGQKRIGHLQALKREKWLHAIELLADLPEHLGEPAGRHNQGLFSVRPLGFDAPDRPVDRVGGSENHA